jgi:hypothetical protein
MELAGLDERAEPRAPLVGNRRALRSGTDMGEPFLSLRPRVFAHLGPFFVCATGEAATV